MTLDRYYETEARQKERFTIFQTSEMSSLWDFCKVEMTFKKKWQKSK